VWEWQPLPRNKGVIHPILFIYARSFCTEIISIGARKAATLGVGSALWKDQRASISIESIQHSSSIPQTIITEA
jgi:hypothetical protein